MKTNNDVGIFILRLMTGILFLIPGIYKVFAPADFLQFLSVFPQAIILPFFYMVTIFEIIAAICLIVGYKVRIVAIPLAIILFVALVTVVLPDITNKIYLINVLFHLLGIGVCIAFMFFGPGKWSKEN